MPPFCRSGVNGAFLCIVLLSGLCSCQHVYKLIEESKTWGEAQQYCRENFADLATVDSEEDVAQLLAAAGDYSGKVWIGLYDDSSSWAWSMEDDGYYGTNVFALIATIGLPRTEGKLCSIIDSQKLQESACSLKLPFLCYDNTNAPSPPRYVEKSWQNLTWDEAQSYCRKFHTDLISVRGFTERNQVLKAITGSSFAVAGMFRRTWPTWSDGTEHRFKNWKPGHPLGNTGDCATSLIGAADAGKWEEDDCNKKLHFMCHHEKKYQLRIKLRALKSTVDLNDPAVTEAILKVLEEKMKEKGIDAGFTLRWVKKPDDTVFQEEKDEL